jgi:hypothetical protein
MYELCGKLVCLSKPVKVTDSNKTLAYYVTYHFLMCKFAKCHGFLNRSGAKVIKLFCL